MKGDRMKLAGCVVTACLILSLASCSSHQQVADAKFDTHVLHPAYVREHPKVLFDEAHRNLHTAHTGYKPFVALVSNDGYEVSPNRDPFSENTLSRGKVLVIVNAMGPSDAAVDHSAFSEAECDAVRDWVLAGGSLLLVTDHAPTGAAAEALAKRFGVVMSKGMTEDAANHDTASTDASQLVFSRENGLLLDHPITRGRMAGERIRRVMTFTGQSLRGPEDAVMFLKLGDSAVNRPAAVRVEKSGGDTRVVITYGDPEPAKGYAQAIAFPFGKGRVVVLGEAAMLTAQLDGKTKQPFGMNVPGIDNRQLALNIMHWLSGAI
jgi:hypothetical protein